MTEFNTGWIEIKRTSQYYAYLRAVDIYIDGQKVGKVANGKTAVFEVAPGAHTVFVKQDWTKSQELSVDSTAGETTTLYCGSEIAGWRIMIAIVYLFMPDKMIYLKREP